MNLMLQGSVTGRSARGSLLQSESAFIGETSVKLIFFFKKHFYSFVVLSVFAPNLKVPGP